jgi:hypothetical protein
MTAVDISLAWGKVEITTWTHKINGLTESDLGSQNRPALQTLNSALCVNPPMAARIACFFVQSQKPAVSAVDQLRGMLEQKNQAFVE